MLKYNCCIQLVFTTWTSNPYCSPISVGISMLGIIIFKYTSGKRWICRIIYRYCTTTIVIICRVRLPNTINKTYMGILANIYWTTPSVASCVICLTILKRNAFDYSAICLAIIKIEMSAYILGIKNYLGWPKLIKKKII